MSVTNEAFRVAMDAKDKQIAGLVEALRMICNAECGSLEKLNHEHDCPLVVLNQN